MQEMKDVKNPVRRRPQGHQKRQHPRHTWLEVRPTGDRHLLVTGFIFHSHLPF